MNTLLDNIINEYQNYGYDDSFFISSYLNRLKLTSTLDDNNLPIHQFILPEVLKFLNKAILNRLAADLLFTKNYWSWGMVSIYYSNFFLAQALNRLKGDFFVYIPAFSRDGRKNIQINSGIFTLLDITNQYRDSHAGELKKFKENYNFLLLESVENQKKFLYAINSLNESELRNNINYKFEYFNELTQKYFKVNYDFEKAYETYTMNISANNTNQDVEFNLLCINNHRFNLLFHILNGIKADNENFAIPFENLLRLFNDELNYKFSNNLIRIFENYNDKKKNFHTISLALEQQFKGLWT